MDNEQIILEIRNYLVLFDYPLVKSMDDEQIANIFHQSNRCFLVSWMLKIIDESYKVKLENYENNQELLGTVLHNLGFCTKNEGLLFTTGKLGMKKQSEILLKIFKFMKNVTNVSDLDKNVQHLSQDHLINLKNMNLNLFPMYGDIKILRKKDGLVQQEIPSSINNLDKKEVDSALSLEEFNNLLKQVKENFEKVKEISQNMEQAKDANSSNTVSLLPESAGLLEKCSDQLQKITMFLEDISTVEDFQNNSSIDLDKPLNNRKDLKEILNMLMNEFHVITELSRN